MRREAGAPDTIRESGELERTEGGGEAESGGRGWRRQGATVSSSGGEKLPEVLARAATPTASLLHLLLLLLRHDSSTQPPPLSPPSPSDPLTPRTHTHALTTPEASWVHLFSPLGLLLPQHLNSTT